MSIRLFYHLKNITVPNNSWRKQSFVFVRCLYTVCFEIYGIHFRSCSMCKLKERSPSFETVLERCPIRSKRTAVQRVHPQCTHLTQTLCYSKCNVMWKRCNANPVFDVHWTRSVSVLAESADMHKIFGSAYGASSLYTQNSPSPNLGRKRASLHWSAP